MSGATLSSTLDSLTSLAPERGAGLQLTELEVTLPVDVVWYPAGRVDETEFVVTPPQWRWRTDFDREPGRLHVRFGSGGVR